MKVKIRRATIKDLKQIQELNLRLFNYDKKFDPTLNCDWTLSKQGEDYFRSMIQGESGSGFVAVAVVDSGKGKADGEKIAGYLAGTLAEQKEYRIKSALAELENMFILEEFRRQGIGSKLFDAFVGWCKSKKVGRIKVVASALNMNAVNFYRKNDFKDHDIVLEKEL